MKEGVLAIVLQEKSGKILLVQRRDAGVWALPGGGIEKDEAPADAVLREVKEETHVDCHIIRQGAHYFPVNRLAAYTFVYVCETEAEEAFGSEETQAAHFFALDALPSSLFYLHRAWIEEILKNTTLIQRSLTEVNYGALFCYILKHPVIFFSFIYHKIFSCITISRE